MNHSAARSPLAALFSLLRVTQWTKNGLVLAAFFFALGDRGQSVPLDLFWKALAAAACFCIVSSSIYILNDMRDIALDKRHPEKCKRPLPAGEISLPAARVFMLALLVGGGTASWFLSPAFANVILAYVLLQFAYTFKLKQIALVDIFILAGGFVLRALAGAVAIEIAVSPWLLLCTFLLALFLALCKRRSELVDSNDRENEQRPSLRQYSRRLLDQLIAIVSAATVVSYSIYTLSPETIAKFDTAKLGFTIPFVIYGLFRYLDLVYRHAKGERPEKILLTDIPTIVNLIFYGATVLVIFYS